MHDDDEPWRNFPFGGPWGGDDHEYPFLSFNIFGNDEDEFGGTSGKTFAFGVAVGLIFLSGAFYLIYKSTFVLFDVISNMNKVYSAPLITVAVFGLSWLLFYLKMHHPVKYGLLELVFALGSTFIAVGAEVTGTGSLWVVVASMYVIVRGLDNITKGIAEWRKKHPDAEGDEEAATA